MMLMFGAGRVLEAAAAGTFVAAGWIGTRRWRTSSGLLFLWGGGAVLLGLLGGLLWPQVRVAMGMPPAPELERYSRILAICYLFRAGGWTLGAAGALVAVRALRAMIEERELLAVGLSD